MRSPPSAFLRPLRRLAPATGIALFSSAIAIAIAMTLGGCNTYSSALSRSQHAFEENSHERALAILRGLEPHFEHLDPSERVQYAYLRGMTDYRIGYKADARHWLALANAIEKLSPGGLPSAWRPRLDEAINDLNEQAYANGIEALSNTKQRPKETKKEGDEEP